MSAAPNPNPVVRLPDPPIDDPPFKALWRSDGKLAIIDTRLPMAKKTIQLLSLDRSIEGAKERERDAEDRARRRVAELAKGTT